MRASPVMPTITGERDMERIPDVAGHFGINTAVCINKYYLNPEAARRIDALCQKRAVIVAGRLPFHTSVVEAMVLGLAVVKNSGPVARAISEM